MGNFRAFKCSHIQKPVHCTMHVQWDVFFFYFFINLDMISVKI